jgi:hypothetical protein
MFGSVQFRRQNGALEVREVSTLPCRPPSKGEAAQGMSGRCSAINCGAGRVSAASFGRAEGIADLASGAGPARTAMCSASPIAASDITGSPHLVTRLRGQAPTSRRHLPFWHFSVFVAPLSLHFRQSTGPSWLQPASPTRYRWAGPVARSHGPPPARPPAVATAATSGVAHRPAAPSLAGVHRGHGLCPARPPPPVPPGVHRRSPG